jgi:hypothetical protein
MTTTYMIQVAFEGADGTIIRMSEHFASLDDATAMMSEIPELRGTIETAEETPTFGFLWLAPSDGTDTFLVGHYFSTIE